MKRRVMFLAIALVSLTLARDSCSVEPTSARNFKGPQQLTEKEVKELPPAFQSLTPLHKPLGQPQSGDWLAEHEETAENYRQFTLGRPVRATPERRTLYIQPLGEFTPEQRKIVNFTAEFLGVYYQLPAKVRDELPLSVIPDEARRKNPHTGQPQILTSHVLNKVLRPRLPDDAAVMIGFTAADLWPGEGWNFVFGEASLRDRVGVWSINRFGDPSTSDEAFRVTLSRTLKTAAHETGHMFSLPHCVYFDCCMNGSNNLPEADRQPLSLCPQCLAKLCYATGADPKKRFEELAVFAKREKMTKEQEFWERSLAAMK